VLLLVCMKKTVLSGIQPSGIIHLGNYLGAIDQWVKHQDQYNNIFCIVDLHAITVPQNPKQLKHNTYLTAATYLASGIDPKESIVFVQSQVPAHSELSWILTTLTRMGELSRMTQFKHKTGTIKKESIATGLFVYPALMAADILLYQTDLVPVGEDQKQHVELTRDLAQRFNHQFGKTFTIPQPIIRQQGARIMALDDPTKKMSKSASTPNSYIALTDKPEDIRKKIMKAVTDSGKEIKFNPKNKGLYNLLTIYRILSDKSELEIEKHFKDKGYGDFKKELAELIIENITPIQKEITKYMKNTKLLDRILEDGRKKADKIAQKNIKTVKEKVGLFTI
jgi:tryptophanyl-tRNA synthetase